MTYGWDALNLAQLMLGLLTDLELAVTGLVTSLLCCMCVLCDRCAVDIPVPLRAFCDNV